MTFFSLGRSFIEGNLPYTEAFDLRGPLTYLIYSLPFLFENYFLGLKFFEILSLWISAIISFKLSDKFFGKNAALFSSFTFCLITSSEQTFLMTEVEIFVLPLLSIYCYLILCDFKNPKKINIFFSAIAICLASLVKSYLSIIGILGCIIIIQCDKNKLINLFLYILGGIIPLTILIISYINYPNGLEILWDSMYTSTAAYTGKRPFLLGYYQFFDQLSLKQWFPLFIVSCHYFSMRF